MNGRIITRITRKAKELFKLGEVSDERATRETLKKEYKTQESPWSKKATDESLKGQGKTFRKIVKRNNNHNSRQRRRNLTKGYVTRKG